jgi:hypothetical protein
MNLNETSQLKKLIDQAVKKETVNLNARGFRFKAILETFERIPSSRLFKIKKYIELRREDKIAAEAFFNLEKLCDFFDEVKNEFYFNKNPKILEMVLGLYSDKRAHLSVNDICPVYLEDELINYWEIRDYEDRIEPGCLINYEKKREEVDELVNQRRAIIDAYFYKADFGSCCFPRLREIIWNIMEKPHSSIYAKVFKNLTLIKTILEKFIVYII